MIDAASPIYRKVKDPSHPVFEGIHWMLSMPRRTLCRTVTGTHLTERYFCQRTPFPGAATSVRPMQRTPTTPWRNRDRRRSQAPRQAMRPNRYCGEENAPTGSREASGFTSETAGLFDLTQEGGHMFFNAVRHLINRETTFDSFVSFQCLIGL